MKKDPFKNNPFYLKKINGLINVMNILVSSHIHFYALMFFFFLIIFSCTKINENKIIDSGEPPSSLKLSDSKLNVILIVEDDIGYEIPTYTGGQSYKTPVMDSLANLGMQFTHCYAGAMCSPSRISLLTGKYGFRNYVNWGVLDTTQKTIANMLRDNGYATCVSGKWQLDGGDRSIHKFGFGNYSVFDPFDEPPRSNDVIENKYRYKNPMIYQNNAYLPDSVTNGKYADNMFASYACKFIETNKAKPFFIYFSFSECHTPWAPPPGSPGYASFDPLVDHATNKNFPDMVNYMDSKIRTLINKVKSEGLLNKTVFIIIGDNGSDHGIVSKFKGRMITGGKTTTTEFGLHVPLIVVGPGIAARSVNKNIVDFTDFMPTIARFANLFPTELGKYGIMDGNSFYDQLNGSSAGARTWSYGYYYPNLNTPSQKRIYVQDTMYKLYDATNHNYFFNLQKDSLEQRPIPDSKLTPAEKKKKADFTNVLLSMRK
jgi:arylsulfatase A